MYNSNKHRIYFKFQKYLFFKFMIHVLNKFILLKCIFYFFEGWGKTSTRGPESDVLLKVNLRVVPLNNCYNTYKATNPIDLQNPKQICTFRRGKDSCQVIEI